MRVALSQSSAWTAGAVTSQTTARQNAATMIFLMFLRMTAPPIPPAFEHAAYRRWERLSHSSTVASSSLGESARERGRVVWQIDHFRTESHASLRKIGTRVKASVSMKYRITYTDAPSAGQATLEIEWFLREL